MLPHTQSAMMAREDAVQAALRAATAALGDEEPTPQALRIIRAIQDLRDGKPARVYALDPIDYLTRLQNKARAEWYAKHPADAIGPEHDAIAGIDTPIGRLKLITWRRPWGKRTAWAGQYDIDDRPITIAEIREAGLAQRKFTRKRKKKEAPQCD